MNIEELLKNNNISYATCSIKEDQFDFLLTKELGEYLRCLGTSIGLNKTDSGCYLTYLFSVDDIAGEQYEILLSNKRIVLGNSINGDLLVYNLLTGHVGYIFGAEFSEDAYEALDDIYIELPYGIGLFLSAAIYDSNYPFDGAKAEDYYTFQKT